MAKKKSALKKALTNAERQARYRQKIKEDPEKYQRHKEDERLRWKKRCKEIMKSERAARYQRATWRKQSKSRRDEKRNTTKEVIGLNVPVENEPDDIPIVDDNDPLNESRQKLTGRRKLRRDRSRLNRKIKFLQVKIDIEKRRVEMYRKRYQRLNMLKYGRSVLSSPVKQTKKLLGPINVSPRLRKRIEFSSAVMSGIRKTYQNSRSNKTKQWINRLVRGHLKKYGFLRMANALLGVQRKGFNIDNPSDIHIYKRKPHNSVRTRLSERVNAFLSRDDNSRITTSKNDVISRKGTTLQRRLLSESMTRLHKKFTDESDKKISYSLFCKLKPFHIVPPTLKDRETCLCQRHENGRLLIERLTKLKLLDSKLHSIEECVESMVCVQPTMNCYERKCDICKGSLIISNPDINSNLITWHQWRTEKTERTISGQKKMIQRTVKAEIQGTVQDLCIEFRSSIPKMCQHVMVMKKQWSAYYTIKGNKAGACIIVVDWSENFKCEQAAAVQSAHFGASITQIALHTGVAYLDDIGTDGILSFCTVSDSTDHGPAAIWAHLEPIICLIRQHTTQIHFWSDGPTTQYRNKQHSYFMSQIHTFGLQNCTWNYFEAGHGKGPADAIGGVVKRLADTVINQGGIIEDTKSFVQEVSKLTKVKIVSIKDESIASRKKFIDTVPLKPIPGSMKIHQLQVVSPGLVSVRNLSCFCSSPELCNCCEVRLFPFPRPSGAVSLPLPSSLVEKRAKKRVIENISSSSKVEISSTVRVTQCDSLPESNNPPR